MLRTASSVTGFGAQLVVAIARRPTLIPTAVRQARRMIPRRWWASRPYLPVPRADYLEFRQVTLSGSGDGLPKVADVILWLDWCRSMHSLPARG